MMISNFFRTLSALTVGMSVASFSASAAPLPADSLPGASGVAQLGLPDRDVVRDPYSSFMSGMHAFSARSLGIVAPNFGVGVGAPPGLARAAAVNGSPSGVPFAGAGNSGSSNSGSSSNGSNSPSLLANSPLNVPPPMPATAAQDLVVGAQAVPESGASAILLGGAALSLYALRRRFARI